MSHWAVGLYVLSVLCLGDFCLRFLSATGGSKMATSWIYFVYIFNPSSLILIVALTEMHFANPHLSRAGKSEEEEEKLCEKASKMHRWPHHFEVTNLAQCSFFVWFLLKLLRMDSVDRTFYLPRDVNPCGIRIIWIGLYVPRSNYHWGKKKNDKV